MAGENSGPNNVDNERFKAIEEDETPMLGPSEVDNGERSKAVDQPSLRAAVAAALEPISLNSIDRPPPSPSEAQAIIDADKRAREQEMIAIVDQHSRRLRCKVFAIAQIVEDKVHTSVQIEAR